MRTSERTPLSRNTLRAAVIVFCTVFIGGLGIGGAAALWSQASTVATTVTTGHWIDYTKENWKAPLTINAVETRYDVILLARHTVDLSWSPQNPADLPTSGLSYVIQVKEIGVLPFVSGPGPVTVTGTAGRATVVLGRTLGVNASYVVTITPYVNGVRGAASTRTIETKSWGGVEWVN